MKLSEAIAKAMSEEFRGVVFVDRNRNETKVLIAFNRLWIEENGGLVPFAPTVQEAAEDGWQPTNDV